MRLFPALLAVSLTTLLIAACASTGTPTQSAAVTGTVTFRERIALPQPTVVVVLQDVSRADAAATQIGKQTLADAGNPPYAFKVSYNPAKIDESHSYAVVARVYSKGELRFVTDTAVPVLTKGAGSTADIVVVSAK